MGFMTYLHHLDTNPSGSPVILLIHGLGVNSESWVYQLQPLSDAGFRPIPIDVPGFGKSPYDGKGWSLERAAQSAALLVELLDTGPVHVVGISMGGVIAQQFALDFPSLTRKLVLVNTFSVLRPSTLNGWFYFLRRFMLAHLVGIPTQAKVVAQRVFPGNGQDFLRQTFVEQVLQADPRAYRAAMRALGFCDISHRLGQIKAATLVITGQDDSTVPAHSQRMLSEHIPTARQVIIPNAGHAVSVERPDVFNELLISFLK